MELLLLLIPIALIGLSFGGGSDDVTAPDPEPPEVDGIQQGSREDDSLAGGAGNDLIFGNRGDDDLDGNGGPDALVGGLGNDAVRGDAGSDLLAGGAGDDSLLGEGGNDVIFGGAGNDLLQGGADDDAMIGGSGADTLFGGDGDDAVSSLDPVDGSVPNDIDGIDVAFLEQQLRDLVGPEVTDAQADRVIAEVLSQDDVSAPDSLFGGAGEDLLSGDNGDTLSGGDDEDRFGLVWTEGNAPVQITDYDAAAGEELVIRLEPGAAADPMLTLRDAAGAAGTEVLLDGTVVAVLQGVAASQVNLANFSLINEGPGPASPTEGDDNLTGTDGRDTISGLGGNDVISGGAAGDDLSGDAGDDSLFGGDGNDQLSGLDGRDVLRGGAQNDLLFGGGGDDTLAGDAGADTLDGGAGADRLDGGDGNDSLIGGAGDTLTGGEGQDRLNVFGNARATGGADDDFLASRDALGGDTLFGSEGSDFFQRVMSFDDAGLAGTTTTQIGDYTPGVDTVEIRLTDAGASMNDFTLSFVEVAGGVSVQMTSIAPGSIAREVLMLDGVALADVNTADFGIFGQGDRP